MNTLNLYSDSIAGHFIGEAVNALRNGDIIIVPTDSLYALACDALNQKSIETICRIKGINPDKNLLSIICSDISMAADYARIDNRAFRILKEYLPGPFTFILPASSKLPRVFKGRKTVGLRIPDNIIPTSLAENLEAPLMCASVNAPLPDDAESVGQPSLIAEEYESLASLMIDSGEGNIIPSTIVDITDPLSPIVIRQGLGQFNG